MELAAAQFEQPGDHGDGIPSHEDAVMVEAEPARHGVQECADVADRASQGLLELFGSNA